MAREFPIHNGRMTTDLDANGHRIKNLPPGSGFTQVQSDWGQTDTTAPDFIKNKPTVPAPVSVDSALSEISENPVQNKVIAEALNTGFTEWEFSDGREHSLSIEEYDDDELRYSLDDFMDSMEAFNSETDALAALSLTFVGDNTITATRHLITPTKTSQLTNDGDGTHAFVKTNDTRLSDARTPTAHTHAIADVTGLNAALAQKASLADLPYALVTPGKWEFSGDLSGFTGLSVFYYPDAGKWFLDYAQDGFPGQSDGVSGDGNELSVTFSHLDEAWHITATRPSLPGHLCDRAGNRVEVSGDTTLTLPALVNAGKARDFLVRLEISGSTVPTITFAAPTGETITYETDGDEFPVPDEAGNWLYSFTETAAHKFAVSLKKVNTVAQGGA